MKPIKPVYQVPDSACLAMGVGKNVDINFIDHIIIGNDEPFSLRMCFMQDEW